MTREAREGHLNVTAQEVHHDMPRGIFVIEWDRMEGALLTHRHPLDLDIDVNDIQKIQIAHQLNGGSSWISIEEELFKVVSFYDATLEVSLVIALKSYEAPGDYVPVLLEMGRVLLPMHERVAPGVFDERLCAEFDMVQALISTNELVLLNMSMQIQAMKEQVADFEARAAVVFSSSKDPATRILLHLLRHDNATVGELEDRCGTGCDHAGFQDALMDLLERNVLLFSASDRTYTINVNAFPARKKREEVVLY